MKKVFSLLAATAIIASLFVPALPASAAPFAGAAECGVDLATWPTEAGGPTTCSGIGVGAFLPTGPVCDACPFEARNVTYQEPCLAGEPPPTGTADGQLFADGQFVSNFHWQRVGVVAVITTSGGAGVAGFVPSPPIPTCAAPGFLHATVVGLAVNAT